jgi:predicted esterase YcpF (UPF0227 family)
MFGVHFHWRQTFSHVREIVRSLPKKSSALCCSMLGGFNAAGISACLGNTCNLRHVKPSTHCRAEIDEFILLSMSVRPLPQALFPVIRQRTELFYPP